MSRKLLFLFPCSCAHCDFTRQRTPPLLPSMFQTMLSPLIHAIFADNFCLSLSLWLSLSVSLSLFLSFSQSLSLFLPFSFVFFLSLSRFLSQSLSLFLSLFQSLSLSLSLSLSESTPCLGHTCVLWPQVLLGPVVEAVEVHVLAGVGVTLRPRHDRTAEAPQPISPLQTDVVLRLKVHTERKRQFLTLTLTGFDWEYSKNSVQTWC